LSGEVFFVPLTTAAFAWGVGGLVFVWAAERGWRKLSNRPPKTK
jgi:hypothetical protein